MSKVLPLSAFVVMLGLAAPVLADSPRLNVPADKWLSVSEVTQKLAAQGYKVTKIEVDDGAYEFDAINGNGVKVEGHAHPATGDVMVGYDD